MADSPRSYSRDVRGRFAKIDPVRDVLAPGLGVPETFAYGTQQRHAPVADDLAQGGQQSPLRARTARLIASQHDAGAEIYATPRAETMAGTHTTESGRTPGETMRYLLGDIDQAAPGEIAATARYGVQGRRVRDAARKSADPMDPSRYLTGAE